MDSEIITAIATIFLVIATILLAYFNMKLWRAQDKPWLSFHIRKLDFQFVGGPAPFILYVKNIGKGPALDVKFKIDLINGRFDKEYESLSPNEERIVMEIPKSVFDPPVSEFYINEIEYTDINGIRIRQKLQVIR